jgi:flagellum-specific peptidoglycan hydrolase FlgJ|nr:MAG TPA: peptidoglycan hydrolase [Caudoviricetes sp.]
MTHKEFIEVIAKYVIKYASDYGIKVHSPIIAQAILESGWGGNTLASKYNNFFGLKCGGSWKGKSVNMATKEEYTVGTLTDIRANFRVFDSIEDGVKGYFEFINYSRYSNLKGVTNPEEYCRLIKADGYATSSTYVTNLMRVIRDNNLTRFDGTQENVEKEKEDMVSGDIVGTQLTGAEIIELLAKEVIKGRYGNGSERKQKLGELYPIIQKRVNELCK